MCNIRLAVVSDAQELAELAESTFRDTFSEQNTAENMDLHCQSSYRKDIQEREISNPDYVTLVAESECQLVAYAQLRWEKPPSCVTQNASGEVQRLYVRKDFHGKGLAQKLMSECLERLAARGAETAWLGVWESNPRAIAFYKKFEFQEVGEHIFPVGDDPQRDIILARKI